MPSRSTTSFLSSRWATITSDPRSSWRPATFWRMAGAVVDDELEVEVRDPDARVALARRRLADVAAAPAEPEVAALDGVEEHRPVDRLDRREGERGVALELGQPEARAGAP